MRALISIIVLSARSRPAAFLADGPCGSLRVVDRACLRGSPREERTHDLALQQDEGARGTNRRVLRQDLGGQPRFQDRSIGVSHRGSRDLRGEAAARFRDREPRRRSATGHPAQALRRDPAPGVPRRCPRASRELRWDLESLRERHVAVLDRETGVQRRGGRRIRQAGRYRCRRRRRSWCPRCARFFAAIKRYPITCTR